MPSTVLGASTVENRTHKVPILWEADVNRKQIEKTTPEATEKVKLGSGAASGHRSICRQHGREVSFREGLLNIYIH